MRKQAATMPAAETNNINPHWRTMLILFAIALLLKKKIFGERCEFKEHMLWDHSDFSDDDIYVSFVLSYCSSTSKQLFVSFVGIPIRLKHPL